MGLFLLLGSLHILLTFKVMLFEAVCDDCWGGGMEGGHEGRGSYQVDDVWREGRPMDEAL